MHHKIMKMKKIVILLIITLITIHNTSAQNESPNQDFSLVVKNINSLGKYQEMVEDAIVLINDTFNSEEFKNKVLNKNFDWKNLNGGHTQMTNEMLLKTLVGWTDKAEISLYIKPRGLRITAYMYGTIGVTSLNSSSTKTYRHWIDLSPENYKETVLTYASHIAHEFCHQRGFTDKNDKPQCQFRDVVPYAIGDIVCEILNNKNNMNVKCDKCSK